MPERKALMCQPVSFGGYVVPGSLPDKCSKCGELVWESELTDEKREQLEKRGITPVPIPDGDEDHA